MREQNLDVIVTPTEQRPFGDYQANHVI